jgi:hypothetical protein
MTGFLDGGSSAPTNMRSAGLEHSLGDFHGCVWYHLYTDQDPKFFAAIKTILLDQILVLTPTQP